MLLLFGADENVKEALAVDDEQLYLGAGD